MKIKQQLHLKCQELLQDRLRVLEKSMNDIYNNLESETKSTAGDKHETGRAMLHLEREKLGHQLAIINNQLQVFNKINFSSLITPIIFESNFGYFLVSSLSLISFIGQLASIKISSNLILLLAKGTLSNAPGASNFLCIDFAISISGEIITSIKIVL